MTTPGRNPSDSHPRTEPIRTALTPALLRLGAFERSGDPRHLEALATHLLTAASLVLGMLPARPQVPGSALEDRVSALFGEALGAVSDREWATALATMERAQDLVRVSERAAWAKECAA